MNLSKAIFILLILFGCKTTEEIQAEEQLQNQRIQQENESRQMLSSLISRTQALEERMNSMNGSVEEALHRSSEMKKDTSLEAKIIEQEKKINSLENELKQQREFIAKVTETLKKLSTNLKK